jgi:hypothetical protein
MISRAYKLTCSNVHYTNVILLFFIIIKKIVLNILLHYININILAIATIYKNYQIMSKVEKNNNDLIRELGMTESVYDFEVSNRALMVSRAYKITCSNKYSLDLRLVEKACRFWINLHPFLQCYIKRDFKDTIKFNKNNKKYFYYLNKDFSEYRNLEYLEILDTYDWLNIIRQDLKIPFNDEDQPLWRLKLVKIIDTKIVQNKDDTNYLFVFTNHHAISDGKSSVQIFKQFLNILNSILLDKRCDEMNEENKIESKYSFEELGNELLKTLNINDFSNADFGKKVISEKCGNKELENNFSSELNYIKIDGHKIKKLVKISKLKTKDVKMTSILSTIACLSIKSLVAKLNPTDIDLNNFLKYEVLVSLREKLKISDKQMGVYSTVIENHIKDDLNENNFWRVAQEQSTTLHDRIKSNQDVSNIEIDSYIDAFNDETKNIGCYNLFAISNIGKIDYDNNSENVVIKINEIYMFENLRYRGIGGYMCFGISTIQDNGDLCWSFNYIENYYSKQFVNDLKDSIVTFIDNLIA